jgi:N-dimethylarginine dimethylaminohydrolase
MRVVMCAPRHFAIDYRINPWMTPGTPVSTATALAQWQAIVDRYAGFGWDVQHVEPVPGLPDMVFAANAGFVLDDSVLLARFAYAERRGEEAAYRRWFEANGYRVAQTARPNEGQGDLMLVGDRILAGHGFRTDPAALEEVASWSGREVVGLRLIDPRFYHLDTALASLGDGNIMWFPGAFDEAAQRVLKRRFPDGIVADEADAVTFGLNAISDGHRVVLAAGATWLHERLAAAGYVPVPMDTSELQLSGGSVKCCTLELGS